MQAQTISRNHTVRFTSFDDEKLFAYLLYQGRLAIKYHPDKNPDDPHAEEKFKEIAIAYQTLSDPTLRKKYNEFGSKESQPEGGFVDPEEIFGAMFGGERFAPIIGQISLAKDMKSALQDVEEAEGEDGQEVKRDAKGKEIISEEERARRDEKEKKVTAEVLLFFLVPGMSHSSALRKPQLVQNEFRNCEISLLVTLIILTIGSVENLQRKLSIFTESATGPGDADVSNSWRTICQLEAECAYCTMRSCTY
jgi:hypothetical protein